MKKVIFTSGVFDLFHYGHLKILKKAKALGDILIVGVSSDELVQKYKKIKPIISLKDRIAIVKELKCVDRVVVQKKLVDINQFKKLKADIFAIADDRKNQTDNRGINWLRDNNKVVWLPYTKSLSTTAIKEKIIANAVPILKAQRPK